MSSEHHDPLIHVFYSLQLNINLCDHLTQAFNFAFSTLWDLWRQAVYCGHELKCPVACTGDSLSGVHPNAQFVNLLKCLLVFQMDAISEKVLQMLGKGSVIESCVPDTAKHYYGMLLLSILPKNIWLTFFFFSGAICTKPILDSC